MKNMNQNYPGRPIEKTLFSNKKMDLSKISINRYQWVIIITVAILCLFGILVTDSWTICSGSIARVLLYRQVVIAVVGMVLLMLCGKLNWNIVRKATPVVGGLAGALLLMLKSPLAVGTNGSTCWLLIGNITIRPDVVVILAVVLMLAYLVAYYHEHSGRYRFVFFSWLMAGVTALLVVYISNKFTYAFLILLIGYSITLVFSDTLIFHGITFAVGLAGCAMTVATVVLTEGVDGFRMIRIDVWLHPDKYADTYSYQAVQRLEAICSGGFWGNGLGNAELPMKCGNMYQDSMFALISETLGWLGAACFIVVILVLLYQLYKLMCVAIKLKFYYGGALSFAVFVHLAVSFFGHIAGNLNLIPAAGGITIPPFITSSGISGLIGFLEVGCVLAVAKACKKLLSESRQAELL